MAKKPSTNTRLKTGNTLPTAGASGFKVPAPLFKIRYSHHLAFSPKGKRVVAAKGGRMHALPTGKELSKWKLLPQTCYASWSPTGKTIAFGNTSGTIRVCDASNGKKLAQVKMSCEGELMRFGLDGKTLFAGDWNGQLFAWRTSDWCEIKRVDIQGWVKIVRPGPDIVGVVTEEEVIGLDSALQTELWRVPIKVEGEYGLCLATKTPVLYILNDTEGCIIKRTLGKRPKEISVAIKLEKNEHTGSVEVSPDGRTICVAHGNQYILFDTKLNELARRQVTLATNATFSFDSSMIALPAHRAGGEIWRLESLVE